MFELHRSAMTWGRCAVGRLALVLLGVAGGACADSSNYIYRPVENATAVTEGFTAARYTIPATAPKGDVRIASFGVRGVAQDENGPEIPAVHVRMIVANDSGAGAWTVDPNEVQIEMRGEKRKDPALVNVDGGDESPQIRIAPGEQRTLDFFYPLADDQDDASSIPAFDVLWKVHTDTNDVAERTPFERLALAQNTSMSMGVGYSPNWWYNSGYYSGYPMGAGSGLFGPRLVGPSMMSPSMGSRFYIHAHPSMHR